MTAATYRDGVSLRTGLRAIARTFVLHGRATRSELTSALILIVIAEGLLFLLIHLFHPPTALGVTTFWRRVAVEQSLMLVLVLPMIGLIFRRSHDVGLSGWPGLLIAALAIAGQIEQVKAALGVYPGLPALALIGEGCALILLVALYWSPVIGPNRYGPDPRAS